MKVKRAIFKDLCFVELCIGDFFYSDGGCLCIKIDHGEDKFNAYNLETECTEAFNKDSKVGLVNTDFIEIIIH